MLLNCYFKYLIWQINFKWNLVWHFVKIDIHSKKKLTFLNKPCVIIADSYFQTLLNGYFKSIIWKINFSWKLWWHLLIIDILSNINFTFVNKPFIIIADSCFQTLHASNSYLIYSIKMFLTFKIKVCIMLINGYFIYLMRKIIFLWKSWWKFVKIDIPLVFS